jgi:hypothetical protein
MQAVQKQSILHELEKSVVKAFFFLSKRLFLFLLLIIMYSSLPSGHAEKVILDKFNLIVENSC